MSYRSVGVFVGGQRSVIAGVNSFCRHYAAEFPGADRAIAVEPRLLDEEAVGTHLRRAQRGWEVFVNGTPRFAALLEGYLAGYGEGGK
jgi:hypothetical protein